MAHLLRLRAAQAMATTAALPRRDTGAPDPDEAHDAWRRLVISLRHRSRDYLGAYGWVLQRQKNGTLHYHAIAHLPWFSDDLHEWRELIVRSGFGVQNKLVRADPRHAGYCARYISTRMADLPSGRRAYGFSRDFPVAASVEERSRVRALLTAEGWKPECEWFPAYLLR